MRFIIQSSIIVVSVLLSSCCERASEMKILSSEFVYETADFSSCHAATLTENAQGDIVAAWFGGPYERHPQVCIYSAVYADGKWSSPCLLADGIQNDTLRYPCWNPVLTTLPDRRLVLFYRVGPSPQTWSAYFKVSDDDGFSWSEAQSLPQNFLGPIKNKPFISDDKIICGSSIETADGQWSVHIETADSSLSKWTKSTIDCDTFQAIQPAIIQLSPDTLMLLCRTLNRCVAKAYSTDGGNTFGKLTAMALPNNNSGLDAISLFDGRHVLVCNPVSETDYTKGRNRLEVFCSADGQHWTSDLVLENQNEGEFSYPAIIQTRDGLLHILYTYNRHKIKHVVLETK